MVEAGIGISLRLISDTHLFLFPPVLTEPPADGRAPVVVISPLNALIWVRLLLI